MRAHWFASVAMVWSMAATANLQVQGQAGDVMPKTQSLFEAVRQGEMFKATDAPAIDQISEPLAGRRS